MLDVRSDSTVSRFSLAGYTKDPLDALVLERGNEHIRAFGHAGDSFRLERNPNPRFAVRCAG